MNRAIPHWRRASPPCTRGILTRADFANADANFSFALNANFDAWLLPFGGYECYSYGECQPMAPLQIQLAEGELLFLLLDGSAGGAASIDVTQQ